MKKTFVTAIILSIIIVATLLTGIACSSQSSSQGLPSTSDDKNYNPVVVSSKLTCVSPSDIHVESKNVQHGSTYQYNGYNGVTTTSYFYVTGEIHNYGTADAHYLIYADCHYADGSSSEHNGGDNGGGEDLIDILAGESTSYNISISSTKGWPSSVDLYVKDPSIFAGNCECHLTGTVTNKGSQVGCCFDNVVARFYDANGVVLTEKKYLLGGLRPGESGDFDFDISGGSCTAKPARYDIWIEK